jgi:hypothetical protein
MPVCSGNENAKEQSITLAEYENAKEQSNTLAEYVHRQAT